MEIVVRAEPRVVPDERRRRCRERAVPERANAVPFDLYRDVRTRRVGEGERRTRSRRIRSPARPSVCIVVFTVSTGIRIMRKPAAARLAKTVWTSCGSFFMYAFEWRSARMPAFAAVSPNRATGP